MRTDGNFARELDALLQQKYPEVLELGFTGKNLISISHTTTDQSKFERVVKNILSNKALIEGLKASVGFTAGNLTSILSHSFRNISSILKTLDANKTELNHLIGGDKFTVANISSMLAGSGENGGDKFTVANISSMLAGSGEKVGDAICGLINHQEFLFGLIGPDKFSARNISSVLNGSGAKIAQAISVLSANKQAFIRLVESGKFEPSRLTNLLREVPVNFLSRALQILDEQHNQFEELWYFKPQKAYLREALNALKNPAVAAAKRPCSLANSPESVAESADQWGDIGNEVHAYFDQQPGLDERSLLGSLTSKSLKTFEIDDCQVHSDSDIDWINQDIFVQDNQQAEVDQPASKKQRID